MNAVYALLGAVVLGVAINEVSDISPWLANRLIVLSARVRYGDTNGSRLRGEVLAGVIKERPGKVLKVFTALWFVATALASRITNPAGIDAAADASLKLIEYPSDLIAQYLFPTEKFRGEWRRHWINLVRSFATTAVIAGLAVPATHNWIKPRYAGWFTLLIIVGAVAVVAWRVVGWYQTRFVLSNKRLLYTEGVFRRRVGMMPLLRVTDLRYEQTVWGQLLGYGTFVLESAGRSNLVRRIVDLPNPNGLYLRVVEEMYEPEAVEARIPADQAVADGATVDPLTVEVDLSAVLLTTLTDLAAGVAALNGALARLAPPVPAAEAETPPPPGRRVRRPRDRPTDERLG